METKANKNTLEIILDKKYAIRPFMTTDEIRNSNLMEIMDEKSKISIEEKLPYPIYINHDVDGEELMLKLEITDEKLSGIYITVERDMTSEEYHSGNIGNYAVVGNKQIPKLAGINQVEYRKVRELCKIYGKFPSEGNLTRSIKSLQDKIKKVSNEIEPINAEKAKLEEVINAFKAIDEIYSKYESSGFDENILNENLENIARYEKTKETLKTEGIKDEVELAKRIEKYEEDIEKLEKVRNNLIWESNQISDSYIAYQKYKEIGARKLRELKKEFICNLKAKDELKSICAYDKDKVTQYFYDEKIKVIDTNIEKLNKEIDAIGIVDELESDDNIDYLLEKISNNERYTKKNHPMNDVNRENEINKLVRSSIEDINENLYADLNAISELYNIESRMVGIQKEIDLKKDLIELQNEVKVLQEAKAKLEILDKYKPIMVTRDKHKDNELFKNSYEKKYEKEIKEYNKVESELKSLGISNWDDYNKKQSNHDAKEQELLKTKKISDKSGLDNVRVIDKITKYKSRRDDIIKNNSNLLYIDIDAYFEHKVKKEEGTKVVRESKSARRREDFDKILKEVKNVDEKVKLKEETKEQAKEEPKEEIKPKREIKPKEEIKPVVEEAPKKIENDIKKNEESNKTLKAAEDVSKVKQQKKEVKESKAKPAQAKSQVSNAKVKKQRPKRTFDQLKKELLCTLKAKDELKIISEYTKYDEVKNFCEGKLKQIETSIREVEKEISTMGVYGKSNVDDKINYMKEKFVFMSQVYNSSDREKYLKQYNSLKENQVREAVKEAIREMDLDTANEFKNINELYTIESKLAETQKGIDLKQEIISIEAEEKLLEEVKKKIDIVGKYSYFAAFASDAFYGNAYAKSFESQIEVYKKTQKELQELKITNKKQFKEAKKAYDIKRKKLSTDKNAEQVMNLNVNKEIEKIEGYRSKQNDIIKKLQTV
ncbi:hypothetical protein [Clostridium felsineum]|uniref:hypothetical protein n=1 Tax=Clostridium felsineum TaxID=36839 RepID=UPI00098CEA83|nr:hypothetical protein [Clostridium felsineum]URZ03075.1 hypothetical protein CLAUR_031210 [Clostridium felsineum]